MNKKTKKVFSIFGIGVMFFLLIQISFSQDTNSIDNTKKLPFAVNFTESELKLLNSLDETTLEKIIKIAKLIYEQKIKASQTALNTQQAQNQSTQTSNVPTSQTPYYNPQTGQYQSTPPTQSQQQPQQQSQNPYSNNLPFSGQQQRQGQQTPQTPLGALLQGVNQGFSDANLDVKDIDPMCVPDYGIKHMSASGCSSLQGLDARIKRITMEACTLIKQQIPVNSAYRSPQCNNAVEGAKNSNHMRGAAIDVSLMKLGDKARTVVLKFKQAGLVGFRCYGVQGHTHFSLSATERDDLRKCPAIVQAVYGR